MATSDELRAQLAEAEQREAEEAQAKVDEENATPDTYANKGLIKDLTERVDYLYEALKDQIQYHGQRNGPAPIAQPITGLEDEPAKA